MASIAPLIRPERLGASAIAQPVTARAKYRLPIPVLLYFLAIAFPIHVNAGTVFLTGVRLLLIVMMIPMCINLLAGKYGRMILTDIVFFLYSIWVIATLFVNTPSSSLSFGGSVAVEFFGGYMLARAYIRSVEDMAAMIRALFILVLFTIPFAIFEGQTGYAPLPELIRKLQVIGSIEDFSIEQDGRRLGLERVQVVFAHPIHYGLFCSSALSLVFIGFTGIVSTLQRLVAAVLICFAAFMSLSSGAILPIMLQLGFFIWAAVLRRYTSKWFILMGLIVMCYIVIDLASSRTPIDVFMSYATFSPHNAYWRKLIFEYGIQNVWANPLVGIGLNDWFRPWFMFTNSVDNFWLLTAMRYGLPGFILLALGFFPLIWKIAWRRIDENSLAWQFRRAWVITFISILMTLCTVDVWSTILAHTAFLLGSGAWFLSVEPLQTGATCTRQRQGATLRTQTRSPAPNSWAEPKSSEQVANALLYTRFSQTPSRKSETTKEAEAPLPREVKRVARKRLVSKSRQADDAQGNKVT